MSKVVDVVTGFVADAPPGEVHLVQKDLETLLEGHPQALEAVRSQVVKYHVDHCELATAQGSEKLITSVWNQTSEKDKFYDEKGRHFRAEHQQASPLDTSEPIPGQLPAELSELLHAYVERHFPNESACSVFPQSDSTAVLVIVNNKYSPKNFWNGRWLSHYVYDRESIKGEIALDIHLYEDSNVRLQTKHSVNVDLPKDASAVQIVRAVAAAETFYHETLNHEILGLNESAFKSLRRQLPVTRAKMNWTASLGNYRLGKDLDLSKYMTATTHSAMPTNRATGCPFITDLVSRVAELRIDPNIELMDSVCQSKLH